MIKLTGITKTFDNGYNALKNIDLICNKGEITALIGPSGCGKTTTMKLMNRLLNPSTGNIFIDGKDISSLDPVELRRSIGYVIQHIGLFPHMTISKNIGVVPKLLKWEKDRIENRVNDLLDLVGLDPETYRERYPSELSGGQQQRIGVIRALAAEPEIILMDEPFSALDPISREQLQDELVRLQKEIKKTIIFVTHDMDEAIKIADKIVLMKDGEIVQQGTPEEILRRPVNDFVENFIGQKRLKQIHDIPTVSEVMVKGTITVSPNCSISKAMKIMESKYLYLLIVVNEDNKLQGYISIFDVVRSFESEHQHVRDIIHPFRHIVDSETLLPKALKAMNDFQYSYLPVVKDDGTLDGLITLESIIEYLGDIYPPVRSGVVV
ncbi:betaine/proline/choline family ABC transporter ATP-binding protein [Siminovitchia sediminis]|uniref:Quaternary amine transport ATP-binding protein n=1 Tax=Siminovitchia sediminis TaxID=1274353 RepID=A0ABW4KRI3_9BACI